MKLALLGTSASPILPNTVTASATVISCEVTLDLAALPACPLPRTTCAHCYNTSWCLLCAAGLVLSGGQCVPRCPPGALEEHVMSTYGPGRVCIAITPAFPAELRQTQLQVERHHRDGCSGTVAVGPYNGFPYAIDTGHGARGKAVGLCEWSFVAPANSIAFFIITSISTGTLDDAFTIYNSANTSGSKLLSLSGSAGPIGTYTATSNVIAATFKTLPHATGEAAIHTRVKGSAGYRCTTGATPVTTSGSVISSSISVDNTVTYNNNANCVWNVVAPTGYLILAVFTGTFKVEKDFDFVHFYNGLGTHTTTVQSYTGETLPASGGVAFQSSGNTATVQFLSDSFIVYSGFVANIDFIRKCENSTPANGYRKPLRRCPARGGQWSGLSL